MKITEIRELSPEDLQVQITEARKELLDLRFQHAARKLENTAKLTQTRKRLAQLLTVQSQQAS